MVQESAYSSSIQSKTSTVDAFKRLRAPRRPRAQSYRTLDGLSAEREGIAWYWRTVAVASTFLILGGFLMLPATYEKEPDLHTTQAVVGIFAVALLTAGFSLTGLLCFAIRNPLFQSDSVFIPSLTSCFIGLVTVFYNFIVFKRYTWNTPAVLTTAAAAVSSIVYLGLAIWTYYRIKKVKDNKPGMNNPIPMNVNHERRGSETTLWQDRGYYENYTRNMWPTSQVKQPQPQPQPTGYDPNSITEEEMQRQQMLMLLLQNRQPDEPNPSSSTFHVDWQVRDEEDGPGAAGYYNPESATSSTAYQTPAPGLIRQWSYDLQQNNLKPWDGVWRAPARVHTSPYHQRATSRADRYTRQQEIEQGRR